MTSPSSEQVGSYRLLRLLATGGMGEVYLARKEGPAGFARTVVVKRLLRHLARDETFVRMFLNEARLAALIAHPNVVQVYELGHHQESYFIAMEYVPGASVKQILASLEKRRALPSVPLSVFLVTEALKGLEQAHQTTDMEGHPLHIVHRDISPDNLLVSLDGAVKVVDFGIAKARALASATVTHTVKGKFAYMAPEQLQARPVDARTDVYSIGVVLYELLTGRRPFEADTDPALIHAAMTTPPETPTLLRPEIPVGLEAVILQALQKAPADRYASAADMGKALLPFLTEDERQAAIQELGLLAGNVGPSAYPGGTLSAVPIDAKAAVTVTAAASSSSPSSKRGRALKALVGALVAAGALAGTFAATRQSTPPRALTPLSSPAQSLPAPVPSSPVSVPPPAPPAPDPIRTPPSRKKAARKPPVVQAVPPGRVAFRVHPWCEVFWNGRALGTTPLDPVSLPAGKQTLVLKNPELGQERRVTVDVPASGEVTVRVNLFDVPPRN